MHQKLVCGTGLGKVFFSSSAFAGWYATSKQLGKAGEEGGEDFAERKACGEKPSVVPLGRPVPRGGQVT